MYIKNVYEHINYENSTKISFQAFRNGFYGYLNLIEAGKLAHGSILTICDFTLSSNLKRMWVIDMKTYKVLYNSLVAHGMGTGEEYATIFSNTEESHQSSLGFYVTGETYEGGNGHSLKLNGVDGAFNSKAYDRAIVVHGAPYVSTDFARSHQRIGRSHGCPALPLDIATKVINKIKNGSCLFIYHTSKNYLSVSRWLKNDIRNLPQEAEMMGLLATVSRGTNEETGVQQAQLTEAANAPKEEPVFVSNFDKNNYRIEVETIILKRGTVIPQKATPTTVTPEDLCQEESTATMTTK